MSSRPFATTTACRLCLIAVTTSTVPAANNEKTNSRTVIILIADSFLYGCQCVVNPALTGDYVHL